MANLIQSLKILVLAVILSIGVSYVYAWTGPTASPPGGNTPAPINAGATSQVKSGGLGVGNFMADSVTVGATTNASAVTSPKFCIGPSCVTAWPNASTVGVCGSSSGAVQLASAPTSNLCNSGTPSVVSGSGPWTWTCVPSGGGVNAACSAPSLPQYEIGVPSTTSNPYTQANGWFTRTGGPEAYPYSEQRQVVIRWNNTTIYDSANASNQVTVGGTTYTPSTYVGSVYGWSSDYSNAFAVIKK